MEQLVIRHSKTPTKKCDRIIGRKFMSQILICATFSNKTLNSIKTLKVSPDPKIIVSLLMIHFGEILNLQASFKLRHFAILAPKSGTRQFLAVCFSNQFLALNRKKASRAVLFAFLGCTNIPKQLNFGLRSLIQQSNPTFTGDVFLIIIVHPMILRSKPTDLRKNDGILTNHF